MITYLRRVLGAHFRSGRALYLLTVAGVTIGVASVLGVQIINRNAVSAFAGTVDAVSGSADLSVVPTGTGVPESILVDVLALPGVLSVRPLVRTGVVTGGGERLDIVGLDLLTPIHGVDRSVIARDLDALRVAGWVAVSRELATSRGWVQGSRVPVSAGLRRDTLTIGRVYDGPSSGPPVSRRLAFMDIAQAQARFGRPGFIDQIDVALRPTTNLNSVRERLSGTVGPSARVTSPTTTKQDATALLAAFRLNLTALSMISVFVGLFLVYSATHAALSRRRREFGVLRSVGTSRRQLLAIVLAEITVLGVAGVALGIPLGYAVASANVQSVSGTLTNLYLLEAVETLTVTPGLVGLAAAVGIGGALAGATAPAWEICRRHPVALLSRFSDPTPSRTARWLGAAMAAAVATLSAAWYAGFGRSWPPAGFVLCVAIVVCIPLAAPTLVHRLGRAVRVRSFGFGYATRSLTTTLHSTTVAVSAVAVAVTMLVGITLMIQSFRRTLDTWIQSSVRADIYVSTVSWSNGRTGGALDSVTVRRLAAFPGVRAIDRVRGIRARANGRTIGVAGVDYGTADGARRWQLRSGTLEGVFGREADRALISEPLSRKTNLQPGDTVTLESPAGAMPLLVAGVYYDYGNEQGALVTSYAALDLAFGPEPPTGVAIYVDPDADVDRVRATLEDAFAQLPLVFLPNRTIRERALDVFDQTFAITALLQVMSLGIAATGVSITLLVLARERVAELALYRAIGASRRQIFRVFVGKGMHISLGGILLGGLGGVALAWILIHAINPSYFGWTIHAHWSPTSLMIPLMTVVGAAALASVYPALRAARVPAGELRHEHP